MTHTGNEIVHCGHECGGECCYYYREHYPRLQTTPCDFIGCEYDTRSRPTGQPEVQCLCDACQMTVEQCKGKQQKPTNCLAIPCPMCGKWIFRVNVDEGYSLFCSSCDWKQKIVTQPPHPPDAHDGMEQPDALVELERWINENVQGAYLVIDKNGPSRPVIITTNLEKKIAEIRRRGERE